MVYICAAGLFFGNLFVKALFFQKDWGEGFFVGTVAAFLFLCFHWMGAF
jgi:hypothetical protein